MPHTAVLNARLFANRLDAIDSLPKGGLIVEVGVAYGDLSEELIRRLEPDAFVGIDVFGWETVSEVWGSDPKLVFAGKTHETFYRDRVRSLSHEYGCEVRVLRGNSWTELASIEVSPSVIYIDAGHDLASVQQDTRAALSVADANTILVFNDYVLEDVFTGEAYGVVPVVNGLLASGEFLVRYLALEPNMFCDIAIQARIAASG